MNTDFENSPPSNDNNFKPPTTSRCGNQNFRVVKWRSHETNTLRGYLSLALPSGMEIHDCTLHEKNSSRWIGLPARQYEKPDGEKIWTPVVKFASADAHSRFQEAALDAVDAYFSGGER